MTAAEQPWSLRTLASVTAVRAVALVGLDALYLVGVHTAGFGGDDALGAGLLAFLLYVVVAGSWGLLDGWRFRDRFGLPAAGWLAASVLFGLGTEVTRVVESRVAGYGPFQWQVLASDLTDLVPFMTGLVLVPALAGCTLVAALTRTRD